MVAHGLSDHDAHKGDEKELTTRKEKHNHSHRVLHIEHEVESTPVLGFVRRTATRSVLKCDLQVATTVSNGSGNNFGIAVISVGWVANHGCGHAGRENIPGAESAGLLSEKQLLRVLHPGGVLAADPHVAVSEE